jgi:hypothetical protein
MAGAPVQAMIGGLHPALCCPMAGQGALEEEKS